MDSNSHIIDRLVIIDPELSENEAFMLQLQVIYNFTVITTWCNPFVVVQQNFNVTIQTQFNLESIDEPSGDALYISGSFEGPVFDHLLSKKKPIISDIIVQHCIENRIVILQFDWVLMHQNSLFFA